MARPHNPARPHPHRILLAVVAAGGLALPLFSPAPALADPATAAETAAVLADRAHELEVVTEEFNEARERLATTQADADAAAQELAAAQETLGSARDRVRDVARGAYTGSRLTSFQAMLTSSSPGEFLDRAASLQIISDHQVGVLHEATAADVEADRAQTAAQESARTAQQLVDGVARRQADLDAQVAQFQAQYDRLAAEEQAAREAAERAAAEQAARAAAAAAEQAARAAAAAAEQAARTPAPPATPAPGAPAPRQGTAAPAPAAPAAVAAPAVPAPAAAVAPVRAAGPAAQTAVNTALGKQGAPYVWGASGPSSFDCSGLVQYAFSAAGISLPHSSRMQSQMGTPVSRSALQPGDLVFFYSPVSHVGIYVGNGQMVHASTYGQPVKVASIDSMGGYNSARRIA